MIKSSKIKTSCLEEINISKEVNALSKRVDEVVRQLGRQGGQFSSLNSKLEDYSQNIKTVSKDLIKSAEVLNKIANFYEKTEKNIVGSRSDGVEIPDANSYKDYDNKTKVFDDDDDNGSYGADQGDMYYNKSGFDFWIFRWFEDEDLFDFVNSYDKYKDYSDDDIEKLMLEINETGCGYAAIVNNIYTMYDGREDEFEKVFGFPMYDEDGEANYNYLMVDLYANTQGVYKVDTYDDKLNFAFDVAREYIGKEDKFKAEFGCDFDGKTVSEEMINSIVNKYKDGDYAYCDIKGISTNNFDDRYLTYLEMKGLEGGAELISPEDNDVSTKQVNEYIDNGKNVNIAVENFNLYNEDGSLAHKDVDYHWMTVTDVTEDGKYVVSSWGERFIFDPSEKKPNKYAVNWMNN